MSYAIMSNYFYRDLQLEGMLLYDTEQDLLATDSQVYWFWTRDLGDDVLSSNLYSRLILDLLLNSDGVTPKRGVIYTNWQITTSKLISLYLKKDAR